MTFNEIVKSSVDSIIEHTPNGVWILNLQKQVIYWNQSAERIFGWKKEEVIGKILPIVPAFKLAEFDDIFRYVIDGNTITNKETLRQKKDGTIIEVSLSTAPYYNEGKIDGFAVIARDITEQKRDQRYLIDVIRELSDIKYALDAATLVTVADVRGKITEANENFCDISKFSREELIGQSHRIINSGFHPKEFFGDLWKTIKAGNIWTGEVRNKAKDGEIFWSNTIIVPFMNEDGVPFQYMTLRTDITARKEMEQRMKVVQEQLRVAAYHDYMTGIPNRRLLEEVLTEEIERTNNSGTLMAVMCLNIDSFKYINDAIGHEQGDLLLKAFATRLKESVGDSGFVARLAGDEFAILLPNRTSMDEITACTEKLYQQFKDPYTITNYKFLFTASVGIAIYPDGTSKAPDLLKNASLALYRAKAEGGNQYKIYTPSMDARTYKMFRLQNDLIKAVEEDQFLLYYQPKVDVDGNLLGAEALLRWQHPEWGMVPPNDFIDLAEKSGNIIPIGEWVIDRVCRQLSEWRREGLPLIRVAINVSALQYLQANFVDNLLSTTELYDIDPRYIEIEITERAVLTDELEAIKKMEILKKAGIHISLDDFGSGYSSLLYLKKFKVNTIKIDQSFTKDLEFDQESRKIISSLIDLAKNLNLCTIAEGVETLQHYELLKEMNCDGLQGYLFSRPIPPEQFRHILDKGKCHIG